MSGDSEELWGFAAYLAKKRSAAAPEPVEEDEYGMPVVNQCPHRGRELRAEQCPSCKGAVQVKVFECSKHLECTVSKQLPNIQLCDCNASTTWQDPLPEKMSVSWAISQLGPPAKRSKQHLHDRTTKLALRTLLDAASAKTYEPPVNLNGRGIVTSGGGVKYFPLAYAMVHTLRKQGCTLPVELWHLGPAEMTRDMRLAIEPLGVEVYDGFKFGQPRILAGWESKPHSIIHSKFAEVLYLDADNLPARDPTYLFDDPTYRKLGAMFWPDLPTGRVWIPGETWDVAGIPLDRRQKPAFESGQVLINKQICWRELAVCAHINDYSDCWYEYVYGDKDTFKLAWHRCGTDYAMPPRSRWVKPAIHQFDMQGRPAFYHACQGKESITKGEVMNGIPTAINSHVATARGNLRSAWSGITPGMGRAKFEETCKARAIDVVLGDGTVLARAIGRFLIYCDPADLSVTPHLRQSGFWESWITLATMKLVQPGWKCVNVGANFGYYSLLLAALSGETVEAFEPIQRTANLLRRSVKENNLPVNVHQLAAYSSAGERTMSYNPQSLGGASLGSNQGTNEAVQCVRLDDVIDHADLIFIDAEGAEAEILAGAERLINEGARIVVEVVPNKRAYPPNWIESLHERWKFRWFNYQGDIEAINQITEEWVMLYLGP